MTKTATKNHQYTKIPSGSVQTGWKEISFVELMMTYGVIGIVEGSPNLAARPDVSPSMRSVFRTFVGLKPLSFAVRMIRPNASGWIFL
ncbi:MAG: hypothetical protein A2096_15065 [Spirochaetes bacterium GWF1_41_5]|nr:MAG: hypothetical protein A2096_15065 [Spirochaetes bacterium GWF1_41_5]